MKNAGNSSTGRNQGWGIGGLGWEMVIIQDGKLGNTEREICKLDFGIEFGMPMNQSVSDVQWATGSRVLWVQLWLETKSVYGTFVSHTHC